MATLYRKFTRKPCKCDVSQLAEMLKTGAFVKTLEECNDAPAVVARTVADDATAVPEAPADVTECGGLKGLLKSAGNLFTSEKNSGQEKEDELDPNAAAPDFVPGGEEGKE